jgi:hypothetical protein
MNVRITARTSGTASVTTSATGATFVSLPANRATIASLFNYTGTPIEWRIGTGTAITLNNNLAISIPGITNTADVSLRRVDLSDTPVTVPFHFQD